MKCFIYYTTLVKCVIFELVPNSKPVLVNKLAESSCYPTGLFTNVYTIQGDSREKVNIFGCERIDHYEKEISHEHVSSSYEHVSSSYEHVSSSYEHVSSSE
jgi:hypothetical protein